jgi:hypothetical protein
VEAFCYDDFSPADTRVVSLGTGYFPHMAVNPPGGLLATLSWTIDTILAAPEDQQTEIVERHYPGILRRYDWRLPSAVDMADASSIPALIQLGQSVATQMDWKQILSKGDV